MNRARRTWDGFATRLERVGFRASCCPRSLPLRTGCKPIPRCAAFTLVELIVVMGVLALVLGLSAPSLARSMRQRHLEAEAARLLAATEFARNEAVSQGVPMVLWIDEKTRSFGVEAKKGFLGDAARERAFTLHPDVTIALEKTIARNAKVQPIEFAPDGAPATSNVETVELKDRFASVMTLARTDDGWSYEITEEKK